MEDLVTAYMVIATIAEAFIMFSFCLKNVGNTENEA